MASYCFDWARRRVCRTILTVAIMAVALPTFGAQTETAPTAEEEIRQALAIFQNLRSDLRLGRSAIEDAAAVQRGTPAEAGVSQVMAGTGQSLLAALCRILAPGDRDPGGTCLDGINEVSELREQLLSQRIALQGAAKGAIELHQEVYVKLVLDHFDEAVCGGASKLCGADPDNVKAKEWWKENGVKAFMLLDRIGREYIKLTGREADAAIANAREYVHARLKAAVARPEIKIAVRILRTADSSQFNALRDVEADRTAALEAVAAVSVWLQKSISERIQEKIGLLPADAAGIGHLKAALRDGEGTALDRLVGGFSETRQRMMEIIALGKELSSRFDEVRQEDATEPETREACQLPDPAAMMQERSSAASPTEDNLREALDGIADFIRLCAGGESGSVRARLKAALRKAIPASPSRVEVLQALCRFDHPKFPGNAEVLRKAFVEDLPDFVAGIVSGSETDLCRRILELPTRVEIAESLLKSTEHSADEKTDKEALTKVREVLTATDGGLLQTISTKLDNLAGELWAIGRLIDDRTLLSLPMNSRGCDVDTRFGLTWQLSQPRLGVDKDGLNVTYSGDLALCRVPNRTDHSAKAILSSQRIHRLAEAEGEVPISLSKLVEPRAHDISKAVNLLRERIRDGARHSLKIDQTAFDAKFLRNAFKDAFLVSIPWELRKRFKFDELGYEFTQDKSGLAIKVPITAAHFRKEFCVVIQLKDVLQGGPEGCKTLDQLKADLWAQLRDEIIEALLAEIRGKVATELEPFLGEKLAGETADADVKGISFQLGVQQAVLEVDVPQVLGAFAGTNLLTVKDTDIEGSLVVALDLESGDLDVISTPVLDLPAIAARLYKGAAQRTQENAVLIAFTPLPRNAKACNGGFGLAMTFGGKLPLEGRVGFLCWRAGGFAYEAPADAELHITLAAGGIRLVVGVGDAGPTEGGEPKKLRLEAALQATGVDDPWGLRDADVEIVLDLDLEKGSVTIPADAEGNKRLYAHIRGRAQSVLPAGATISRLELSTQEGIEIKFSGLEDAAFSMVFDRFFDAKHLAESKARFMKLFPERNTEGEVCWALRAGAVGEMLTSLEAPEDMVQNRLEKACDSADGRIALRTPRPKEQGTNELALLPGKRTGENGRGAIGLRWTCRARTEHKLRSCDIEFPELDAFCDGLRVRVAGNRKITVRGAEQCLQKTLEPLVPPSLREYGAQFAEVELDCPDPKKPSACGVTAKTTLSFEQIGETIEESAGPECELELGDVELPVLLSLDGQLRLKKELGEELRNKAVELATYSKCVLTEKLAVEGGTGKDIGEMLPWLGKLKSAYTKARESWPREFKCRVALAKPVNGKDTVDCSTYVGDDSNPASKTLDLLLEPPKALIFSRSVQLFDTAIDIEATIGIRGDGELFEPALSVSCPGCHGHMDELAEKLARMIANAAGDTVNYERGASLTVADRTVGFSAPLSFEFAPLGINAAFEVDCSLTVGPGTGFKCGAGGPSAEQIIAEAVSELITERVDKGFKIPLGPLTGTIIEAKTNGTKITLVGTVAVAGMEPPVDVEVALPLFGHRFQVNFDAKALEERLGKALADQLTDLVGTVLPVTISKVTVSRHGSSGLPEGVKISSNADIAGFFKISVPDVILERGGLRMDGPSELAFEFEQGVPIPVPPVTICPRAEPSAATGLRSRQGSP